MKLFPVESAAIRENPRSKYRVIRLSDEPGKSRKKSFRPISIKVLLGGNQPTIPALTRGGADKSTA